MEKVLRNKKIPLLSSNPLLPLINSISWFLTPIWTLFHQCLNMLDFPISLFSPKTEMTSSPLIIAGGPLTFNPAPIADFFDAMVIGDGRKWSWNLRFFALQWKEAKGKKENILKSLSQLGEFYVPVYTRMGKGFRKRIVSGPHQPFAPPVRLSHYIEGGSWAVFILRSQGLQKGVRFCEAGSSIGPTRERSPEVIHELAQCSLSKRVTKNSLLLSSGGRLLLPLGPLLSNLMDRYWIQEAPFHFPL